MPRTTFIRHRLHVLYHGTAGPWEGKVRSAGSRHDAPSVRRIFHNTASTEVAAIGGVNEHRALVGPLGSGAELLRRRQKKNDRQSNIIL